jgi:Immunoglobulin-like domain of bacterial spore germination
MIRRFTLALTTLLVLGACDGAEPTTMQEPRAETPAPSPEPVTSSPSPEETQEGKGRAKPPIVVTQPKPGDELTSPFELAGSANVFEATVSYRLVADGSKVAEGFTTATCGSGCRGTYSKRVRFDVEQPTEAVLQVFESSAEDGSRLHTVKVEVTLLP